MSDDWPKHELTFRGEEYLSSLLLSMVLQHCGTGARGELDSHAIKANFDAMICCAEDGYIQLTDRTGKRILAVVTPEGWTLLERLRADQEKEGAAEEAWIERMLRERPHGMPKDKLTAEMIENPRFPQYGSKPRKADET
jgi:hypothetical protein